MICMNCPEGRRFAESAVNCLLYGMITRAEHECTREGGKRHDRAAEDHGAGRGDGENADETGGGRRVSAETLPGVLYESAE